MKTREARLFCIRTCADALHTRVKKFCNMHFGHVSCAPWLDIGSDGPIRGGGFLMHMFAVKHAPLRACTAC